MIMKKYLHSTLHGKGSCETSKDEGEWAQNPDFENARLIGYFRIARLKFLSFSGLFGLGVIWFGLMYLLHMDEGIRTFDLLKIALLLMMGCLAHLCWRAMLVVEKALILRQGDAAPRVKHAICFCHLSSFMVSLLAAVAVYGWLSGKELTLWAMFVAPTVFVAVFKVLMIEHTKRILQWFDSESGQIIYPLNERKGLSQKSHRIISTIYWFFVFTYVLVGIVLYNLW